MPDLPSYEEALDRVRSEVVELGRSETVPLEAATGRILHETIRADRDQPPFDRSAMDGYALRHQDLAAGDPLPSAGMVAAGDGTSPAVSPGCCIAIATGAVVPGGLDTVIQHELTDRGDLQGGPIRFEADGIKPGNAIHPQGADAREGDALVEAGECMDSIGCALAAATGALTVQVRSRPRVFILTSGDEIIPVDSTPKPHQVRNTNAILARDLSEHMGARVAGHAHLPDEPCAVKNALEAALGDVDLLITVGGISAGDRDFIPGQLEALGIRTVLEGACIQPGKPIRAGLDPHGTMVLSLPGNPVSVLACTCLFLWPIVHAMLGARAPLPWRDVRLGEATRASARRQQFRPAHVSLEGKATVPQWAGSGDLAHSSGTCGLLALPVQPEVPADTRLRFLPWPS